jgi:hypothetical protein
MDLTTINKYTKGFSNELLNLIVFIEELIPTETTQNILSKYPKINTARIIKRYHGIMNPVKGKLTNRDVTIFSKPLFIIPEFNISFFWENLPEDKKNNVWEKLSRLLIYSNIIIDSTPREQRVGEQNSTSMSKQLVKKGQTKEVNPFVGIGENNTDISVSSLQKEVESGKVDGNPIMKALKNKLNIDELSNQLKNVDKDSISQMTEEVRKIITPNVDDPQVSGLIGEMLTNIGDELKNSDLSNGNLFETMLQIAEKMSTKLANDASSNKCSPEKLLASTQSIMKSIGMPENMNPVEMMSGNDPSMLAGLISGMSGMAGGNPMESLMSMMGGLMK